MIVNMQNKENNSVLFGNTNNKSGQAENHLQDKKNGKSGSIYSGNMNLCQDDITMKKVMAHKKALKTVLDTYTKESKVDDNVETRRQRISELQEETKGYSDEIKNIENKRQELKEKYGITDDYDNQENAASTEQYSEYQTLVSEYDKRAKELQRRIKEADYLISAESSVINEIGKERLKSDAMIDAKKEAADILEEASKDIIGILIEDSKDQIDEDMREKEEKMEEEAKKKEEEKQRLEELKEKSKEEKDKKDNAPDNMVNIQLLNQITKADIAQDKLQSEIKTMLNTQVVLDEDIKGIEVDEQL